MRTICKQDRVETKPKLSQRIQAWKDKGSRDILSFILSAASLRNTGCDACRMLWAPVWQPYRQVSRFSRLSRRDCRPDDAQPSSCNHVSSRRIYYMRQSGDLREKARMGKEHLYSFLCHGLTVLIEGLSRKGDDNVSEQNLIDPDNNTSGTSPSPDLASTSFSPMAIELLGLT